MQRNGQPTRRTNTVGQPTASASPWMDRKISLMRRRGAHAVEAATTARSMGLSLMTTRLLQLLLQANVFQLLLRQFGDRLARITADDALERGPGLVELLQRILGIALLEQCPGCFFAVGKRI